MKEADAKEDDAPKVWEGGSNASKPQANEKGEVDCFQFISSNGTSANGGAGITIFRYPDVRPPPAGRERARVPISDGKTIAMRASAKKLTGPLGRQTYIFENHFCVVDLPVRGGSVEVLFVGAKFKDGTLATATTSVQTDNAPSSFDLLPWLLAQGVPLEVARPKAKPDEYGRF